MSLKIENSVLVEIKPIVESLGFEIEYIEFVKEGNQNILRIVIDKPGDSIHIDNCETVSRAIEETVDKLVSLEYILEVASPGLERVLKNVDLYTKYINSEIYIKLYKNSEFGKEIIGMLVNVNEEKEEIVLSVDDKEIPVLLKDISTAHTTYDFGFSGKDKTNLNKLGKF